MVEGARLESVYMFHKHIEGSNPSLSATFLLIVAVETDRRHSQWRWGGGESPRLCVC